MFVFELTAKTISLTERVRKIKKTNISLNRKIKETNNRIRKINTSKIKPNIKTLRIKKLKALQEYYKSSIMLNTARIKELS